MAAVIPSAGVSIGVVQDSNITSRSSGEPPPFAESGNTHRDDASIRLSATAGAAIGNGGTLSTQVNATFTHVESRRFDDLSHNEHNVDFGLSWTPTSTYFDASLQLSRQRTPTEFADVGGEEVRQQTTLHAQASFRIRPTPRWQIGVSPPGLNDFSVPLEGSPKFEFRKTSGSASLDYLGAGPVVPGLVVGYARGRYSQIANATRSTERSIQGTLNYRATGFSTFSLAAGHTERTTRLIVPSDDPQALLNEGTSSGFTGSLGYQRQLTAKTGINVSASRAFGNYSAGANNMITTGFNVGVSWAATAKLAVTLDSQHNWSTISGIQAAGTDDSRKDKLRYYSLGTTFAATQRVALRGYITRRMRKSNIWSDQFNGTAAGLEMTVKLLD